MTSNPAIAASASVPPHPSGSVRFDPGSGDLKGRAIRGGVITLIAQIARLTLNLGSTVILARLLTPSDYGLLAMVTAFTGFVEILKDGGLSLATIQRDCITEEQISALFWLNSGLGGALTLLSLGLAPFIALFYNEPRLAGIAAALAITFLLGGLGVQHQALLRRNLRFTALAAIDLIALGSGAVIAITLARFGAGYWALVGMSISSTAINTLAVWFAAPWRPGPLRANTGVQPMIGFGSNIIVIRFIHSFIRNVPNILLGWYWGAVTVGLYQRAYTLLMFAVDQIQGPIASVALSPMSRVQRDTERLKRFYLAAYSAIISAIVPVVVTCAVYAEEIVAILLGPQWAGTASVFRWLSLSGVFIGINHPQGMLLLAMGRAGQCTRITLADALGMVVAYIAGVHFGAVGVAVSFLIAKTLMVVPLTYLALYDTTVSGREMFNVLKTPLLVATLAGLGGWLFKLSLAARLGPWALGVAGCSFTLLAYGAGLLFGARRWAYYRALLDELRPKKSAVQAT